MCALMRVRYSSGLWWPAPWGLHIDFVLSLEKMSSPLPVDHVNRRGGEAECTDHQPRRRLRADRWETGEDRRQAFGKEAHCGGHRQRVEPASSLA
ncbi:hypothetical protein EYF80_019302 [Liparis tanakae]|uniref:Uncharacterized protein n=1 Tax=Liparis tanakae TaxID=230148 RepID=A0A4Z2HYM8_9TELE|nr:hypothetical protein EYF80_019302 [Liparis tanakae]